MKIQSLSRLADEIPPLMAWALVFSVCSIFYVSKGWVPNDGMGEGVTHISSMINQTHYDQIGEKFRRCHECAPTFGNRKSDSFPTVHKWERYAKYTYGPISRTQTLFALIAQRLTDKERAALLNGQGSSFARPFRGNGD